MGILIDVTNKKINVAAEDSDVTPDELAELERLANEATPPEPTTDERIAELEEALDMLLSGVTK